MEKYIYDEKNGLHYELVDDYYLPCLTAPEPVQLGVWGMRRSQYLKEHKKILYLNMLTTDTLNAHLKEIDQQAEEMFFQLVNQFKTAEGITEQLKAENQLAWVQRMNNIHQRSQEIVNECLIFTQPM